MDETTDRKRIYADLQLLSRLRNPWGLSRDEMTEVRLQAADRIEHYRELYDKTKNRRTPPPDAGDFPPKSVRDVTLRDSHEGRGQLTAVEPPDAGDARAELGARLIAWAAKEDNLIFMDNGWRCAFCGLVGYSRKVGWEHSIDCLHLAAKALKEDRDATD